MHFRNGYYPSEFKLKAVNRCLQVLQNENQLYFGLYVEKCNYGLRCKLTRPNVAEKEIRMLEN